MFIYTCFAALGSNAAMCWLVFSLILCMTETSVKNKHAVRRYEGRFSGPEPFAVRQNVATDLDKGGRAKLHL